MSIEEFIQRARQQHGDRYDYALVCPFGYRDKVSIICLQHGVFQQSPYTHLHGSGCTACYTAGLWSTTERFITKARIVHGDRYNYSKVDYCGDSVPVAIQCAVHGEFQQRPFRHLAGSGCKRCGDAARAYTTAKFVDRGTKLFDGFYNYSLTVCTASSDRVQIICPIHGEFIQLARKHMEGHGCMACARSRLPSNAQRFIAAARKQHGDTYDYSLVRYVRKDVPVTILCKTHGEFQQRPDNHQQGSGCQACKLAGISLSQADFLVRAHAVHGTTYDYSETKYRSIIQPVDVICRTHGAFRQQANSHLHGRGCQKCGVSAWHAEVLQFLTHIYSGPTIVNDRKTIAPLELDIFLPELRVAVELHGLYWHAFERPESAVEKRKHQRKALFAKARGINLLQFFEHEWSHKREIIESMLRHRLRLSPLQYHARKCTVVHVPQRKASRFFAANHLQGSKAAAVTFGLEYAGVLVSGMSFARHPTYGWEIARHATLCNTAVCGGTHRMLRAFCREYAPSTMFTYSDLRYASGSTYAQFGFQPSGITAPGYFYCKGVTAFSRQHFQKHKLQQRLEQGQLRSFDPSLSESQNMFSNGYGRVWDAGHARWIYTRP